MPSVQPYAVIDIDGVVADVRHRLYHLQARPKDWDAFFAAATRDPVLPEGAAVASRLAADHDVVWLTGRPERCHDDTVAWLHAAGLPGGSLRMRRYGDFRPARVVKLEVLRTLARQRPVDVLVDDDQQVLGAAAAAGFAVYPADWMGREPTLAEAQESAGRT
ncbi:MAG: hypothetical protein M3P96_12805 [Actinomycetota bacterium]|nr:hypothetical protein [Actinomycetota bacterium]